MDIVECYTNRKRRQKMINHLYTLAEMAFLWKRDKSYLHWLYKQGRLPKAKYSTKKGLLFTKLQMKQIKAVVDSGLRRYPKIKTVKQSVAQNGQHIKEVNTVKGE